MQIISQIASLLPSATAVKPPSPNIGSGKQSTARTVSFFAMYHAFIPFSTYLAVSAFAAAAYMEEEEVNNKEFDDIGDIKEEAEESTDEEEEEDAT